MSEENKVSANAEAEQDVQNVFAELNEAKPAETVDNDNEEARIVARASKLGEESEHSEEKFQHRETRGPHRVSRANNSKFDPSSQTETDDPIEIRKQVEFYFSDSNLPLDKFLLSQVGGNANNAVPLSLLHSFKRMRRFQPFSAIVEALKTSETLELTDDDTAVKRKVPLPQDVKGEHTDVIKVFEDKTMPRSVYAKGFGGFDSEGPTTQLDIEAFFQPYGPVQAVRLRRTRDKTFKGSVFVEFKTEEKQKEFLALDPKPQWKGEDLLIKSKKEYCEEKVEEIKAGNVRPSQPRGRGGRGRGRGGRGRGGGDRYERDWRERRQEDQKNGFQGSREVQKDSRGVPVIQSTAQKRARDDETTGEHPAKKVDAKE